MSKRVEKPVADVDNNADDNDSIGSEEFDEFLDSVGFPEGEEEEGDDDGDMF